MGVADFETAIARCHVLGLDTGIFIYHLEDNPVYANLTQPLFAAVETGRVSAEVSALIAGEVLTGPKKAGDTEMMLHYRHVFGTFPNLNWHDADMQVMETMSDLRAQYGLRTPDAIHLATALLNGAAAFVTNDAQLKAVMELEVLVLEDFVGGEEE